MAEMRHCENSKSRAKRQQLRRFCTANDALHSRQGLSATTSSMGTFFSMQPTFTQGLILGQLSILILLALILKYLFLDSSSAPPLETSSYQPRVEKDPSIPHTRYPSRDAASDPQERGAESAEWFNLLLHHVRTLSMTTIIFAR